MASINFNGKICKEETPIIEAGNRGLRYGDGLFETIKILNGRLILADEHFARLWKGMQVLQFTIAKHFNPDKLEGDILLLAKKNEHEKAARVRITVLRGNGGLYDATDHFPNYIIQTWALPPGNGEWNSNGLVLGVYNQVKKSCDILSNIKNNNYLPYVMAALKAKNEKWNDAVVLNSFERVCDSTIANIFIIKDEVIYTPALSEGCVAGILRKHLIGQLAVAGFACFEKEITINELLTADEVFLTNSIYNIRWVQHINGTFFTNTVTQKIYAAVMPTIS